MSAFASLSAIARAGFALWALLLCLTGVGTAVFAAERKRWRFTALALALLAPAYFVWQVIFDLSLSARTGAAVRLSAALGGLPWLCWLGCFLVLTIAAALLPLSCARCERSCVSPGTVKLFLDRIDCGVCCWRDDGRVLFSNLCMDRLCVALTGSPLRNGNAFRAAAQDGLLRAEDRVWRFTCREILLGGERLHELIASDVTAEYARTQALERDKAELSALNGALREYYRSIDEAVRRQEILQARVNIHDEMNRLMLSTTAAGCEDAAALDRIFSLWEQNALLLCMEAEDTDRTKAADGLEKLAAALRLRLVRQGTLPDVLTEAQRSLFFSAAQEAMVNAVKHAEAKTVEISVTETEAQLCCRFTNDGRTPQTPVRFTGGLANLALLAKEQGASLSAQSGDVFTLTLCIPKHSNKENQPIGGCEDAPDAVE